MATALQKQLATIQATRKNELDLKAQKAAHGKSLLFEPKVATQQSFDVIYQLCREGFEELCALDHRFTKFSKSLFSQASKSQDRDLLTAKQNEDLDILLENFLELVGARILLQSAHLATEWLIRRFRVHERNTQSLVLTFLPYHATPVFLTLMSILPSKLPAPLKFLHRYINAYTNPPRDTLVQAAIKNPSFFSALNSYVLRASKVGSQHATLISLWASVLVQSIDSLLNESKSSSHGTQQQRSEDLLTKILPVLNNAMDMKKAVELVVGCHMIVIVLVNKLDLDDRLLDALMTTVALSLSDGSTETGLAAISLIAERKSSLELARSTVKILLRTVGLTQKLSRLSHEQSIRRLVLGLSEGYLTRVSEQDLPEVITFFEFAMSSAVLSPEDKRDMARNIFKSFHERAPASNGLDGSARHQIEQIKNIITSQAAMNDSDTLGELSLDSGPNFGLVNGESHESMIDSYESCLRNIYEETGLDLNDKKKDLHNVSFFTETESLAFERLANLFEAATQSEGNIQNFLSLSLFNADNNDPGIALITFLARFWCSQHSVTSKCHALQIASKQLEKAQGTSRDFQALMPYFLCALADNSLKVRRLAADIITVVSRMEPTKGALRWGEAAFNPGNATKISWLSTKDYSAFIRNCIVPTLEECVSDSGRVCITLQQALEKRGSSETTEKGKMLGKEQKSAIFEWLSSHVRLSYSPSIQLRLLRLVNSVANIAGSPRSKFLLPCLKDFVAHFESFMAEATKEHVDRNGTIQEMFRVTNPTDAEAVTYVCNLATGDISSEAIREHAFLRLNTLWPRVSPNMAGFILNSLLSAALPSSSHHSSQSQAVNLLKSLSISSISLLSLIHDALQHDHSSKSEIPSKKRRTSRGAVTDTPESQPREIAYLARLTLLMEMIENSKNQQNVDLFKTMFKVLQELQSYGIQTNSDLSYLTNLTLTTMVRSMHVLGGSLEARRAAPGFVRPDLLVDCIRNTSYPRNRSSALLILSFLAKQTPQMVLHSIMPIFTMMSATTARLSDEFSAHVVDQTIKDVMPVLVQKLHEEKKDLVSATAEILLSFAAAFEHIPPYRRLQLFKLLASSLGADETLFAIITALIDAYPENDEVSNFSTSLCRQFGALISLTTVCKTLDLTLQGIDRGSDRAALFHKLTQTNAATIGPDKTIQNLMDNILVLLRDLAFQKQLQADLSLQNDQQGALEQRLQTAFETILKIFLQSLPSMKQKAADVLEHLLVLFPFESLARSSKPLLSHPDEAVCKGALNTLHTRIKSTQQASKSSKIAILDLLSSLTSMIQDGTRVNLQLNVLACIDQICEKFGRVDPSAVLETMKVVSSPQCLESPSLQVQTVSYYCLASSLDILRDDFIPLLKSTEKSAYESLARSSNGEGNEKLHNAVIAYFVALVDTMPYMISGSCLHSLLELFQEFAKLNFSSEARENRSQLLVLFASKLEIEMTALAIEQAWSTAAKNGPLVLHDLSNMVQSLVESRNKSAITRHVRHLFSMFTEVLDIRSQCTSQGSQLGLLKVDEPEKMVIEAMLGLVLKINDTIFRPFFNQLLDWSSSAVSKRDVETKANRTMTFFNLTFALSERLKSIFTPYFGHTLERASTVLQAESSNIELRKSVLKALTSSFKHDNDDFWQAPSHFDQIIDALAAQFAGSGAQRIQAESITAFTEFAVAASSSDHHKEMNGRLLKLFRSDSARTRLTAVKCQQSVTERLGEEWLNNLPEMLPSINELQEDDDEEVEKETNRWIKLIENKLGESLNSMLQ